MKSFKELDLSPEIARAIEEMGFETPSAIQAQALPLLLDQATDLIGLAATGTGKTAAFGIPLLEKIDPQQKGIQGLILCPTRELAVQVAEQLNLLGKYKGIKTIAIYGGVGFAHQVQGLKRGHAIVVATPGRLIDHLENKNVALNHVHTVILDEADEMISMGFKEDLETILDHMKGQPNQRWFFSATLSPELRRVAETYLKNPKTIQINRVQKLPEKVEQLYYITRERNKADLVCTLIDAAEDFYGLIFCQTKVLAQDLADFLREKGLQVDCLHGDMNQAARERTLSFFRQKKIKVLVCTDVAARGIDVKDITHVLNYSLPRETDSYIHRIGRTARSGQSGIAITLVLPSQTQMLRRIESVTKSPMKEGEIPKRKFVAQKKIKEYLESFNQATHLDRVTEVLDEEWIDALKGMKPLEVATRFLSLIFKDQFEAQRTSILPQSLVGEEEERKSSSRRRDHRPSHSKGHRGGEHRGRIQPPGSGGGYHKKREGGFRGKPSQKSKPQFSR